MNRPEVHLFFIFKVIVTHQISRAPLFYNFTNQGLYEWAGFRKAEIVSITDRGRRASKVSRYV